MKVDLLYLTKNRLEFTKASWESIRRNTNWNLVSTLWICDDFSTDGTAEFMLEAANELWIILQIPFRFMPHWNGKGYGAPAAIMNQFVKIAVETNTSVFAKLDNDVVVPLGWLDAAVQVMEDWPRLDLLGLEPPASRTPHHAFQKVPIPIPEETGKHFRKGFSSGYAPCRAIGGVGLMRVATFRHGEMTPKNIYGGFTEWQYAQTSVEKGWIVPPIDLFLLDRMPTEPWRSLSKLYISKGWQREWTIYPADCPLWSWWSPKDAVSCV